MLDCDAEDDGTQSKRDDQLVDRETSGRTVHDSPLVMQPPDGGFEYSVSEGESANDGDSARPLEKQGRCRNPEEDLENCYRLVLQLLREQKSGMPLAFLELESTQNGALCTDDRSSLHHCDPTLDGC